MMIATTTRRRRHKSGWASTAVVLALLLAACASGNTRASTPSSHVSDPSLRVAARIPLGSNVSQLAAANGRVWVAGGYDGGVRSIDIASGKLVADLKSGHGNIPGGGTALAVDGSLWVAYSVATDPPDGWDSIPPPNIQEIYRDGNRSTADLNRQATSGGLVRFDSGTGRREKTMLFLDWSPGSVALTPGAVWIAIGEGVARIDPSTYEVMARLPARGELVAGFGSLWVAGEELARIDPSTDKIAARIQIPAARDVAIGPDAVWVTTEQSLLRIDPLSNRVVATIQLADPWGVAVEEDAVWVTGFQTGTFWRIDPESERVQATIELGGMLTDVVGVNGSAWVAFEPLDSARAAVLRIDSR